MVIELGHGLPFLDVACILFLVTLHVHHHEVCQSDALNLRVLLR